MTWRTNLTESSNPIQENRPLVYLATPYSYKHDDADVVNFVQEMRFRNVSRVAGLLMNEGVQVLSPITHGHSIAEYHELPRDWKYWKKSCESMISVCNKVIVLCQPGWEESTGVTAEIELAQSQGLFIEYLEEADIAHKMKGKGYERFLQSGIRHKENAWGKLNKLQHHLRPLLLESEVGPCLFRKENGRFWLYLYTDQPKELKIEMMGLTHAIEVFSKDLPFYIIPSKRAKLSGEDLFKGWVNPGRLKE